MNLVSLLAEPLAAAPERTAMIETRQGRDQRLTYAELAQQIAQCAGTLQAQGIVAGDTALVFQPMSTKLYIVLLALMRLGAQAMFLDPSAGKAHIARCCERLPPKAFIATPKAHLLRLTCPSLRRIPLHFSTGTVLPFTRSLFDSTVTPVSTDTLTSSDTPALITFTSGSTGLPKGAVRTHGMLLAQYRALHSAIDLSPGQVDLATLPIFTLANLAAGLTTVIPDADLRRPGSIDPVPVLQQIQRLGVTRCTASPALFECLLAAPDTTSMMQLEQLYTGGAPVFPDLLDRLAQACPKADPTAVYGSTEAEPVAHIARSAISAEDRQHMINGGGLLAGEPVDAVTLQLDQDNREIIVTGEHVLTGYLDGVGDAETKINDGVRIWHRTGDAGYLDAQNRLWLLGRTSARILDDRGELWPFAIECAARQCDWVKRSALVLVAQKRVLVVEAATQADMTQLQHNLADFDLDEIRLVETIPVDQRHNAKVDYPALKRLLQEDIEKPR